MSTARASHFLGSPGAGLAQGDHPAVNETLTSMRAQWHGAIEADVVDPDVAQAIMPISDGLYDNSALAGPADGTAIDPDSPVSAAQIDRLLAVLKHLTG